MKFIHLTDTHLVEHGGDLFGTNPRTRLEQAVAHICEHHADAEALVITGDLTHLGQPGAYAALRECLEPLPMPVHTILGNHDGRENYRRFFPEAPRMPEGFVQYARPLGEYLALFLDTQDPGEHWGAFCETRACWLREQLQAADRPVVLFMHHPFFPVGIASMDALALREPRHFLAAIAGHEARIRHIFMGHIHRPIFGSVRGMPFSILRGTNHQVALVLGDDGSNDILGSHEPPQYGVVLLDAEQVVVHAEDYLDRSDRFYLHAYG
ncbi:metallophosphoesterase [Lampropedia cohaerens]|uniref:Metallophosphoesterase n=1 Tax=Lampropedia cohaerens TaxID=1610491 RepID=A0A0U1Q0Y2_9BURK|nr:phosphodiesterase [Lampropedia cohaerens]KKW68412.1 metallophosphoesterase [Lampropedia cohaerens]